MTCPWKLIILSLCLYLSFWGGHYVSGDNAYRLAWARSLLYGATSDISEYFKGESLAPGTTCKYGIGQTLVHMPFLLVADGIFQMTGIGCEGPVNMLVYVVNGVLGVVLVFGIAVKHGLPSNRASILAFVVGATSMWFPLTKLEYGESLVTTLLLGAWLAGPTRPMLSGLLAGLSTTMRTDGVLWAAVTFFAIRYNRKQAQLALVGVCPGILIVGISNYLRYGSLLANGYAGEHFDNPVWLGVYGLLFSFGKSLFLFNPVTIGSIFGWRELQNERTRDLFRWSILLLLAQVLTYGAWWDWSGDDSWGPRFLTPAALALQTSAILWSGWKRWSLTVAVMVGLLVNAPGVLIGPHTSLMLQHTYRPTKQLIYMKESSPITIDDSRFNPHYSQVVASWELLLYRLTGIASRNRDPVTIGSTWLQGFSQVPSAPLDIFWLRLIRPGQRQ